MEELLALLDVNDNRFCADCGKEDTQIISINHACFICPDCAVIHKVLGSSISHLKPLHSNFSAK